MTNNIAAFPSCPRCHESIVALVNFDVNPKRRAEGDNLHVVTICTALSHTKKVIIEHTVDIVGGRRGRVARRGEAAGSLAFGVPTSTTTDIDIDELFVVAGILTHVVYDPSPDHVMVVLVAVELVGKSVEEAVACRGKKTC